PPVLRAVEGRAFQATYLRGAAECYRAGLAADADRAFHAAAKARPEFLGEAASLRRFCHDLMPTGAQRQDIVVLHWREATRTLLVAFGGMLGSIARYWLAGVIQRLDGVEFPFGTLGVNVLGSFIVGVVMALSLERGTLPPNARIFLAIGLCGGFTTMSTFSY